MASLGFLFDFNIRSMLRASSKRFDVFACYKLETFTQPSRCVGMSTSVLRQCGIQIDCRSDIVSVRGAAQNVHPSHNTYARGESRTPDQGLMSPLLYH